MPVLVVRWGVESFFASSRNRFTDSTCLREVVAYDSSDETCEKIEGLAEPLQSLQTDQPLRLRENFSSSSQLIDSWR